MSTYENWNGKLTAITKKGDDLIAIKDTLLRKEEIYIENNDDINETFRDEFYEDYIEYNGIIYEIDGKDNEEDIDCYINMKKNEDGTIQFNTRFYNGGTGLSEMLFDGLEVLIANK